MITAEIGKTKLVPYKQSQVNIAETSESLNAYTTNVYAGPRWRLFPLLKQTRRRTGLPREYSANLLPANPLFPIKPRKFTYCSNNPLTRPPSGAD